jgi:hypothetical protein
MRSEAQTVDQYLAELADDRKEIIQLLRKVVLNGLPIGFKETINYGMITYEVPISLYPAGYRSNPDVGLIHIGIANQKNHISFYHMGLYANQQLHNWFMTRLQEGAYSKLDMGKSCMRFKKSSDIPLNVIQELVTKLTVNDIIFMYETLMNKEKKLK